MQPPSLPSALSQSTRQVSEKPAELLLTAGSASTRSHPSQQVSEKRAELMLPPGPISSRSCPQSPIVGEAS